MGGAVYVILDEIHSNKNFVEIRSKFMLLFHNFKPLQRYIFYFVFTQGKPFKIIIAVITTTNRLININVFTGFTCILT